MSRLRSASLTCLLAAVLSAAGQPLALSREGAADVLIDQQGRAMPASALSGHFLLVYFGYTSCPDVCPTALATMARALELLGKDGHDVLPLFVTVDPQRDTVEVIRAYVANFSPRLIGLTGSAAAVAAAQRAFNVTAHPAAHGAVDHSPMLYFAGPDGKVLRTFHANQTAEEIAGELRAQIRASGS